MIPEDCKPCPKGGYCPGQQDCGCGTKTMGAMRREAEGAVICEMKGLHSQLTDAKKQVDEWKHEREMTLTAFAYVRDGGDPISIGHPSGSEFGNALRGMLDAYSRAALKTALDYHRRWQEAEAKMVAMEEARNAAMRAEGEAKAAVKLLRKALEAMTGQAALFNRDTDYVWVAVKKMAIDALTATAPKGEQG